MVAAIGTHLLWPEHVLDNSIIYPNRSVCWQSASECFVIMKRRAPLWYLIISECLHSSASGFQTVEFFQSFYRPETMTSYVSQRVQKMFSVRFVFEDKKKKKWQAAWTGAENLLLLPEAHPSEGRLLTAEKPSTTSSCNQTHHQIINLRTKMSTNTLLSRSQNYTAS